ncbi:MAG: response regulator transcription factor [Oscillospiraceae bacterium]|nr:response regulator transcription factor [Oscillospiraceae bacterium]
MSEHNMSQPYNTILICDDDPDIVRALAVYLERAGFQTQAAYTGQQALTALAEQEIDLILLDIMMPELDGIRALQQIRETYNVPVILISAKSENQDKINGLNFGADDYITKPFNPQEVIARVQAQLRRYTLLGPKPAPETIYSSGGLMLDDASKDCTVDGRSVNLTASEFNILKFLLSHKGQVFSSERIYQSVWKNQPYGSENTVAVHICHIREKIEANPKSPIYLTVIWGKGYKIEAFED